NHYCFLLLRLLRCFSSARSPSSRNGMSSTCRVAPFGNLRIDSYVPIPAAYRSLSRPSSPLGAQASAVCPYLLSSVHCPFARNGLPLSYPMDRTLSVLSCLSLSFQYVKERPVRTEKTDRPMWRITDSNR